MRRKRQATVRVWTEAAKLGTAAPAVIAERLRRLGTRPWGVEESTEALRMVSEKVVAAQHAQWLLWQSTLAAQQRAWWQAWAALVSGRVPRARIAPDAALDGTARALAATRRRVQANARRLRRRS